MKLGAQVSVFRGEYIGRSVLEELEETGLLYPRIRVRYPDSVARRFWLEMHQDLSVRMKHPVEPDGPRWEAAVDLENALYRWRNYTVYEETEHPFDELRERFIQFIEVPSESAFQCRRDRRVDVSSDIYDELFDDHNVEEYYSSWQVLLAAEVAEAGVYARPNFVNDDTVGALLRGIVPENLRWTFNFVPVHATRDFSRHEKTLDAVVWFAERRGRLLARIWKERDLRQQPPSEEERISYYRDSDSLAAGSAARFGIGGKELVELISLLAERWSHWEREGRPKISAAYETFLDRAVVLTRRVEKLTFDELRDRVGSAGGRFKPILDVIWPNWAEEEKERVRLTLKTSIRSGGRGFDIADSDVDDFVRFIADNGLEAFFWRLKSFEDHALRGNEFSVAGMQSDIQGISVAIEHLASVLGGVKDQLYESLKQLWRHNADVLLILKRNDVTALARNARLIENWPLLKGQINAIREERGVGEIVADLVMAHRIRGGVHHPLPEKDHFELQTLFVCLMRAALYTFVEVQRNNRV